MLNIILTLKITLGVIFLPPGEKKGADKFNKGNFENFIKKICHILRKKNS